MSDTRQTLGGRAQLLRSIFDQSVLGIALTDLDGTLIEANEAFMAMLGYTPEELRRLTLADLSHPDDWLQENRAFSEHLEANPGGKHFQMVKRYRRKDGTLLWANLNACMIRDSAGRPVFRLGMIEDITERKQAEDRLRESESRFRLLFTEMVSGFALHEIVCDAAGKPCDYTFLDVNPAFEKLTGLRRDRIVGHTVREVMPGIEDVWIEKYGAVAQTGIPASFASYSAVLDRWYEVIAYSPRPGQFAVTFTDITERKAVEQRLAEEKERLGVTLRSIGDAVVATDAQGRVCLVNRAAEAMSGWPQAEALGHPVDEVLPLRDRGTHERLIRPFDAPLTSGRQTEFETPVVLVTRDGPERIVTGTASAILDAAGRPVGLVLAFRDVTLRLTLEQEQVRAAKLESLGFLAGGIAHDFNNLLTAIQGNISMAEAEGDVAASRELLAAARQAALDAQGLTLQLLTFARGGTPIKTVMSPLDIIRESAELAVRGSSSRIEFHLPPALWPVDMDAGQIGQVIRNLVINAHQAMPGGGRIVVRAENLDSPPEECRRQPSARCVRLSITDSGVGIPESHLDKIFDPYFTTKQDGSGLGLATSMSIVRHHGGTIRVQSRLGIGTTFDVYLPAVSTASALPDVPASARAPAEPQHARVLLMDDEEAIRQIATRILTRHGFTVVTAQDGKTALDLYLRAREDKAPFDVVILDLTIRGGMGGRDTMQQLLLEDPHVKAIVSSGYSTDPVMSDHRRYGFRGMVPKPYQIESFVDTVRRVAAEPA